MGSSPTGGTILWYHDIHSPRLPPGSFFPVVALLRLSDQTVVARLDPFVYTGERGSAGVVQLGSLEWTGSRPGYGTIDRNIGDGCMSFGLGGYFPNSRPSIDDGTRVFQSGTSPYKRPRTPGGNVGNPELLSAPGTTQIRTTEDQAQGGQSGRNVRVTAPDDPPQWIL